MKPEHWRYAPTPFKSEAVRLDALKKGRRSFIVSVLTLFSLAVVTVLAVASAAIHEDGMTLDTPRALQVLSHGSEMRATLYLADGQGPHPTVVLLHGFPGGPGWAWLAGPLREAGFNVLFLHPRGMWGSEGTFGPAQALDDIAATVDFLRSEPATSEFLIDPDAVILVGHSFGGWLALKTSAARPEVACVAALTPGNLGQIAQRLADDAGFRASWIASMSRWVEGDAPPIRVEHDIGLLVADLIDNAQDYDARRVISLLHNRPVLLLAASDDRVTTIEEHHAPLLLAFQESNASRLTEVVLPTDHMISNRRALLVSTLAGWLRHECLIAEGDNPT